MHTRNAYPAAQSLDLSAKPALALARRGSHGRRALLLANDDILIGVSDRGMAGSDGVHWAIAVGRIFHGVAGQQMAAWRKSCKLRHSERMELQWPQRIDRKRAAWAQAEGALQHLRCRFAPSCRLESLDACTLHDA